jgi:hypothetical protein
MMKLIELALLYQARSWIINLVGSSFLAQPLPDYKNPAPPAPPPPPSSSPPHARIEALGFKDVSLQGYRDRKKSERYHTRTLHLQHACRRFCGCGGIIYIDLRTLYTPLSSVMNKAIFPWMMNDEPSSPPCTWAPYKAARGKKKTQHLCTIPSDIVWSVLCCFMKIHLDDSPEISRDTGQRLSDFLV